MDLAADEDQCPGAQLVLAAATELFAAHGYDGVSVTAVARQAGVSKANVFHHFVSKEQLYLEVLKRAVSINLEKMAPVICGKADFQTRLTQMIRLRLEHMFSNDSGTRLVMREVMEGDGTRVQTLANRVFHRNLEEGMAFFETARKRGEVRADLDPKLSALLVSSVCVTFFQCREVMRHTHYAELMDSVGHFAGATATALLRGMQPLPVPARRATRKVTA